jgi:hypothetical protein
MNALGHWMIPSSTIAEMQRRFVKNEAQPIHHPDPDEIVMGRRRERKRRENALGRMRFEEM